MRPPSCHPRLWYPAADAAASSSPGRWVPRCSDTSRSSSSRCPRFLERIDHRMGVAAEGHRDARSAKSPGRSDAVGQIAFGRRTDATRRMRRPQQSDVTVAEMCGMNRREAVAEHIEAPEQLGRGAAVNRDALLVLRRLLAEMGMQRGVPGRRPIGNHRHRRRGDAAHRVDRRADLGVAGLDERVDSRRPRRGIAVAEPLLGVVERRIARSCRPADNTCRAT